MSFNYNHLFYFYTIARLGGVSKAARHLRIAQPSLSTQLKTLEENLGCLLFEKVGRNLVLTSMGERVFEYCRNIFEAAEELSDFLSRTKHSGVSRYRFGVSSEIDRTYIADILGKVIRESMATDPASMTMLTLSPKELSAKLLSGEVDVIVSHRPVQGPHGALLARIAMPVVMAGTPGTFPKSSKGITAAAFLKKSELRLVLPSEEQQLRLEADLYLQRARVTSSVAFESDMLSVVIRAVREGVGVGFVPKLFVERELSAKKLDVYPGAPLWTSYLYVYSRKRKLDDPLIVRIKKSLVDL